MNFYFTRREYDPTTDQFTKKLADTSSYVVLPKENVNAGFRTDQAHWLSKLQTEMASNEVAIFVHGFNTSQATMMRRLRKVKRGLRKQGFNGAVAAFAWPNRERRLAYVKDKSDVPKFAPSLLEDGIRPILNLASKPKVHLICHSMGAYVCLKALSGATGNRKIGEVVFVAGDLDQPWFNRGEPPTRLMENWATRATNYFSTKDQVLDWSENLVHGDPRIGRDGLPHPTGANHVDVDCTARYRSPAYDGKRSMVYSHSFYFDDEIWLKDMAMTLCGKRPDTRGPSPNPPDSVLLP